MKWLDSPAAKWIGILGSVASIIGLYLAVSLDFMKQNLQLPVYLVVFFGIGVAIYVASSIVWIKNHKGINGILVTPWKQQSSDRYKKIQERLKQCDNGEEVRFITMVGKTMLGVADRRVGTDFNKQPPTSSVVFRRATDNVLYFGFHSVLKSCTS